MKRLQQLFRAGAAVVLAVAAVPAVALEGRVIVTGLNQPLQVTAPKGDRRLFVVEKTGVIRLVRGDRITTFLDLSDRVAIEGERGLLGLAFDPHYDTPVILKAYAERYQYDPKKWNFVTGAMTDIDAITDQFNLTISVQNEQWDHKLRTVIIDAQGKVQEIVLGNQWKSEEVAEEIIKAAQIK